MKKALKETVCIILKTLPWLCGFMAVMLVVLPDVRAYAFENPRYFVSVVLRTLAILYGLMLAAQLVLVWVRAEKKEEDAS
ncbi:MAG: hypothetical protein J6A62_08045 [Oscillospiraceae bacterium]|nr:hypothetical protein [Oscillospiraceae bacterium]